MTSPKTSSTWLVVPVATSGQEPAGAPNGTLSFDPAGPKLRAKGPSGWFDVAGGGGGGTITGVTAGTGLTGGGTSGTVTVSVDFGTGASQVRHGNDSAYTDARTPTGSAGGDLTGTYPNPTVGLHAFTSKATPVGADEIFLADSAASFANKRATLTSIAGLFTSGVSSFNSRTGAVVPQTGDYTASQVGLGSVTNDAQLKRSANDFTSFTQKATPIAADILLLEDSAASGAKKYATLSSLSTAVASTFNPSTSIAPEFYWKASNASNTIVSGRCTVLAALGSDPTVFNSTGTQAPLQNTDGNGNQYLQFDSTGGVATAMQQSGASSAFKFMHDGTVSWTMILVHDSPGGMSSGADEFILDSCGGSSASIGFSLRNEDDSGGFHGPLFSSSAASSGQFAHLLNGRQDINSGFVRFKEITVVRYYRGQHKSAISGVTPTYADIMMFRNGVMTCYSNQNATYSASNPSFALVIGKNANTGTSLWNGRLYELMITKKALSDRQIANMCGYANSTYAVVC